MAWRRAASMLAGGGSARGRKSLAALGLAVLCLAGWAAFALTRQARPPAGAASGATLVPDTASARTTGDPPAPGSPRDVRISIAVSGDLLPHLPIVQRAQALAGGGGYDFKPMLRPLAPLLRSADLAFCHLEAPLQPGVPSGYPRFRASSGARGGDPGDRLGRVQHRLQPHARPGPGRRAQHPACPRPRGRGEHGVLRVGCGSANAAAAEDARVDVAFLSYTTTTNGLALPRPWSVNLAEPGRILRDARRARRRGADAVVVNLHWGTEYQHRPDAMQWCLARRLTRSDAITALVGQHAHVVQPIRRVRGRWVVFGTGNLLSNQTTACCPAGAQDGMVALLDVRLRGDRDVVAGVRYAPTWVRHPDYRVLPVGRAIRRAGDNRPALRASWRRTVQVVGRRAGLQPIPRRSP